MNKNLLIIGGGQYGAIAKETAEAMGCFEKIDFLDDNKSGAVGKLNDYENFADKYSYAFTAFGNSELRLKWIQKLEECCFHIPVLVHPKAYISPSAQIGKGSLVEPNAAVQANSTLAIGVYVSANAVINHNSFVGDGCHIDCGAVVGSNIIVPARTKIECGRIIEHSEIINKDKKG